MCRLYLIFLFSQTLCFPFFLFLCHSFFFFFFCPTDRLTFTREKAMRNETLFWDGLTLDVKKKKRLIAGYPFPWPERSFFTLALRALVSPPRPLVLPSLLSLRTPATQAKRKSETPLFRPISMTTIHFAHSNLGQASWDTSPKYHSFRELKLSFQSPSHHSNVVNVITSLNRKRGVLNILYSPVFQVTRKKWVISIFLNCSRL